MKTNLFRAPYWQSYFNRLDCALEWSRALRRVDHKTNNTDGFSRRAADRLRKNVEVRDLAWKTFIYEPHFPGVVR